jgi:type IV pilus assembly protein PilA
MHEDPALSDWYYADAARDRHGPLSTAALLERLHDGRLQRNTLVWRDGMPEWKPLHALAHELGLPAVAPAPPLPPATPASAPVAHAAAPPRNGLSGIAIGAIVAVALGAALLVTIGILAAVAVPTYQAYTLRAKAAMAIARMAPLQTHIASFAAQRGRCPVNGDPGFGTAASYAGELVAQVRIGRFDNGHCGLEATLHAPRTPALDGKALWLDYDERASAWKCSSELDDRYLPAHCRGG